MSASSPILLALDTSTEQCSVVVRRRGETIGRVVPTARGHADMILPLIQEIMAEAGVNFADLDAIAFGRGPGAFTGVRLAVGVVQGLAAATHLPVVPISDLAAIAQQAAAQLAAGARIVVCMDARMGEVYTAAFSVNADGLVDPLNEEQVCAPELTPATDAQRGLGAGFAAYPQLQQRFPTLPWEMALPRAHEVALLAERELLAGRASAADQALPVYLRDQVVHVKTVTAAAAPA